MEAGREEAPSAALLRRSPEHNVYIRASWFFCGLQELLHRRLYLECIGTSNERTHRADTQGSMHARADDEPTKDGHRYRRELRDRGRQSSEERILRFFDEPDYGRTNANF